MNILLVDDDEAFLYGMEIALRSEEYRIFKAQSIGSAFEILNEIEISLICSDYSLRGDTSIIDLMEYLREYKKEIVVIVISARDEKDYSELLWSNLLPMMC